MGKNSVDENEQMDTLNRIPVDHPLFLYHWDLNDIGALSSKRMYIARASWYRYAAMYDVQVGPLYDPRIDFYGGWTPKFPEKKLSGQVQV